MNYRGRPLSSRPFTDATGEGVEWFETIDGKDEVRVREHAIRVIPEEEANQAAATAQSIAAVQAAADEREAIYQLARATVEPSALAAKVAEVAATRAALSPVVKVDASEAETVPLKVRP